MFVCVHVCMCVCVCVRVCVCSDESHVNRLDASCDKHDVDVCVSSPPGRGALLV